MELSRRGFFVGEVFCAMLRTIVARRDWEGKIVLLLSVDGEEYLGITKVEFCISQ